MRGVQYYSVLVPEETYPELTDLAKEVGWAHLRPAENLADHPVIDRIHVSVRHLEAHAPDPKVLEAVAVATEYGLADTGGAGALLAWASDTGMDAGRPWEGAIKQWIAWGEYRPPRRPGLPKGGIAEVLKRTSARGLASPQNVGSTEGDGGRSQLPEQWTFGRETEVSRVPIRLR